MWRLLDTKKITELRVEINWTRHDEDDRPWEPSNGRYSDCDEAVELDESYKNTDLSETLVSLLQEAPNIKHLFITSQDYKFRKRRYENLNTTESLRGLQDAFRGLSDLHTLSIDGKFFHPSFFIVPPESTRTVIYKGLLSDKWFREFCQCRLTNVTQLVVHVESTSGRIYATKRGKIDFDPQLESVNDVKFTGLRDCKLELFGSNQYSNTLQHAILRRNRGLNKASRDKISNALVKNSKEMATVVLTRGFKNHFTSIAKNRFERDLMGGLGHEDEDIDVEKSVRRCLQSLPTDLASLETWENARNDAKKLTKESGDIIKELIVTLAPHSIIEYTQKQLKGRDEFDVVDATMESLRRMIKILENTKSWNRKERRANEFIKEGEAQAEEEIEACTQRITAERVMNAAYHTESLDELHERITQECVKELGYLSYR
ncbi:hypothetical protein TWF281_002116 [Arthrobotrys megalospora]